MDTGVSWKEKPKVKKQKYSIEYKREAARLMIIEGMSAPEVSEKLEVKTGLLYRWRKEHLAELEGSNRGKSGASPTEMATEIDQLRKRLAKAERINQILKKTVSYFAKDE